MKKNKTNFETKNGIIAHKKVFELDERETTKAGLAIAIAVAVAIVALAVGFVLGLVTGIFK